MAVNLQENPLYFRMFQVLVTLSVNMKVDLCPQSTIQTQYHLLCGEIQRHQALSHLSLLAFRLQPRLILKEIPKTDSAFHGSTAWRSKHCYGDCRKRIGMYGKTSTARAVTVEIML